MKKFVKRTIRLIKPKGDERSNKKTLTLHDFETANAYVLLGEPGMGKSTEFFMEACRIHALPPIPAHQFINGKIEHHPEWKKGPLFIDGLDEVRVGGRDPRDALNKLIEQLKALGKPQFRLSCRSVDWLESGDQQRLATISGSKIIPVLLLDPLNNDDIRNLISDRNANALIRQAHEHRMETFLRNPQLLDVLIKSVKNDGWSNSPAKTFKNACQELIRERNLDHRNARSSNILPSTDMILRELGYLSVLMLITNKTGWSVEESDDSGVLSVRDVETQNRQALNEAFRSRFFEGELTCRTPIHRLMTEFLGARYLHQEIQNGLSVRRVFALLMGADGALFPDLRGLAAWLASLNPQVREILIHTDPTAVAFNGDTSSFSLGERRKLLKHLECTMNLTTSWPSAAALGALVGHQGESLVWELTGLPARSEKRQVLVYQLLRGLSQRYSGVIVVKKLVPEWHLRMMRKNLLNIVYDPSWQDFIRCEALRTMNMILVDQSDRKMTFSELLSDLQQDLLSDEKNDLRGTILDLSYPNEVTPSQVWDYLLDRAVAYQHSMYMEFWHSLTNRSQEHQIRDLLDSLCNQDFKVIHKLAKHWLSSIIPELLARGLELFGDELDLSDLYHWFSLVEYDVQTSQLISIGSSGQSDSWNDEASIVIRQWLGEHETIQRALIEHDLIAQESKVSRNIMIGIKFVGPHPPAGFRLWCLTRATELWNTHPTAAERLAWWSVRIEKTWEDPLSDKKVKQLVSQISGLSKWNRKRLHARNQDEQKKAERNHKISKIQDAHWTKRQKELEDIQQQKSDIAMGNCTPRLLHDLASAYFNGLAKKDVEPKHHLESYLKGDMSLVQAVLTGFRSMLDRDDLPNLKHIAQLHKNNKMSYYTLPFLAGMEEQNDSIIDSLSENGKRRALGFYLVTDRSLVPAIHRGENQGSLSSLYENYHPPWYEKALKHYPEAVADSLIAIHKACVHAKLPPSSYLYEMVNNPAYFRVAQLAVKKMILDFPTRSNERQLESLRVVLWSTIRVNAMSTEELRTVVLQRLQRKNMDIAQRAHWLCAGIYAARDHCLGLLEKFLSTGQESRYHRVLSFLVPDNGNLILQNIDEWSSKEISRLILALGKRVSHPDSQNEAHLLSKEEINSNKFHSLLTPWLLELSRRGDHDSIEALESLATNPDMYVWQQEIVRTQEEWNRERRISNRPYLSLEEVQKSIRGGPPASAADLTALTTDVLEYLADHIRNGQTNEWLQYWCRDPNTKKPSKPQHEKDCRDVLLSHLNAKLNIYQVNGEPEERYADEKRADIRISYGSANLVIPIEIKKMIILTYGREFPNNLCRNMRAPLNLMVTGST